MATEHGARIPTLDGLRAISIVLVIAWHAFYRELKPYGDLGNLGVRVFFVISGLLITSLLLEEQRTRGRISLGGFYLRRAVRIFPAYYAFLAAMVAASALGWVVLNGRDLAHALTYTVDYLTTAERSWTIGHIWSLSVEEQFYLIWPLAVALLGRRSMWVAVAAILLVPVVRIVTHELFVAQRPGIKWEFQTVCDALATGCLLAFLRARLEASAPYRRLLGSWLALALPAAVLLINWWTPPDSRVQYLVGITAINVGIALAIHAAILSADGPIGRWLEAPPMVWLGTLSYSLYLWQQPFLQRKREGLLFEFPYNLVACVLCACASYYLLERPLLGLRARLRARSS